VFSVLITDNYRIFYKFFKTRKGLSKAASFRAHSPH
jgi:hypothetical protein